jgi:hypothetical protein
MLSLCIAAKCSWKVWIVIRTTTAGAINTVVCKISVLLTQVRLGEGEGQIGHGVRPYFIVVVATWPLIQRPASFMILVIGQMRATKYFRSYFASL